MITHLEKNKMLILDEEQMFAQAVGARVVDKPKVTFWLVLMPILFLYFFYRMQQYKKSRMRFAEEFMITRQRALSLAWETAHDRKIDFHGLEWMKTLSHELRKPYQAWMEALVEYYKDLLVQPGNTFPDLVRSLFQNRSGFLLALNRLSMVERDFYTALKPLMKGTEGAMVVISSMESHSRILRRELAERIFP